MSYSILSQNKVSPINSLREDDWDQGGFFNFLEYTSLFVNTLEEIRPIIVKCYHQDCHEKVIFECKCLDERVFICKTHVSMHFIEHDSKTHTLTIIKTDLNDQKRDKLHDCYNSYNSSLEDLKQKIASKVSDHFNKINKEMIVLFENIDTRISQNKQMMADLMSGNQKIFESMDLLDQFLEPDFKKKCEKIDISDVCLDILEAEINDWNATKTNNVISNTPKILKLVRKLLPIQNWEKSLEIITNLERWTEKLKKPILHWCDENTNIVHYFDFFDKTQKSEKINGLGNLRGWSSISIDCNNILLIGENHQRYNQKSLNVLRINIKTKSTHNLPCMNVQRTDFGFTYLNGFYYVLGGKEFPNYPNKTIKNCEKYSLEKDKWENIPDLNEPRHGFSCVAIPKLNSIYIFGGKNELSLNWTIEKLEKNHWTIIQLATISGDYLRSCLMPDSNIIMIFGGKSKDSEDQKECYFYDYEINQFTNANPMICNSTEIVSKPTIFDNKMYCYFEKKNWQESDNLNLLIYDIKSGIWSAIT